MLAKALGTVEWDVAIAGTEATDSRMSVVPALVAEALGRAAALAGAQGRPSTARRSRSSGSPTPATTWSRASTPAVISVVEKINEPRYPSFKGIMAAKSKPIQTLSLGDLGIDAGEVGLAARDAPQVVSFEVAPPRQAGQVVKDEGDGAHARSPTSSRPRSSSDPSHDGRHRHMAEVLVLVDSRRRDGPEGRPSSC